MKSGTLTITVAVLAAGLACSKQQKQQAEKPPAQTKPMMAEKEYMVMGEYVNAQDSLPRLRYFDGEQVSVNDRCAVRKVKLNPKMPPIYVNGQPIGFC
jgi:hypothetical protein